MWSAFVTIIHSETNARLNGRDSRHCFKQNSQIRREAFDDKLCSSEVLSPLISSLYSRAVLFFLPEIILIFEALLEFRDFLQRGYKTVNTNHTDSSPLINY